MLALLALPIAPVAVRVKVLEIEDAPEGGVIVAVGAEVATVTVTLVDAVIAEKVESPAFAAVKLQIPTDSALTVNGLDVPVTVQI